MRTTEERFWAKVDRSGPIHPTLGTPCWLWTGALYDSGYGAFRDADGRSKHAHRVAFRLQTGSEPPVGLDVCHKCDVRRCVRGDHLFVGSRAANMADAKAKGRSVPPPIHRGVENHSAKLTDVKVIDIRRRYGEGARQVDLAEAFGVSQAAISKIVRGEWWKHLDGGRVVLVGDGASPSDDVGDIVSPGGA